MEKKHGVKEPQKELTFGRAIYLLVMLVIFSFFLTIMYYIFAGSDVESLSGNVALIPVKGIILGDDSSDFLFDDALSSQETIEMIEKAGKNPNIRAIIFEINSPGGSPVASEEIANAIKKTNKTSVAWIREIGTSGAYWVASSTDYIIASRVSITGSIGVIASYTEFSGIMKDYNLTYRRLISGKYKDIGDPFKELVPEEQEILQSYLDSIRDYFVEEVAKNRNMKKQEVEKAANGLFYLGGEAKKLGLIDEIGGKDEAIAYIEEKEGITADIVEYESEKTLLDLFAGALGKQSFSLGMGIGKSVADSKFGNDLRIVT